MTRESDIEAYLVQRVKAMGGAVRKVAWVGHNGAPDRLVMLPEPTFYGAMTLWVELKSPETIGAFPANAHERAQAREHERMRDLGQWVAVLGTREQVDEMLRPAYWL